MKRIFFAKLIVLALLATVGCSSESGGGQHGEDGSQFLGEWQVPGKNIKWEFSKTQENGVVAEYQTSDGRKTNYAASYNPQTKALLIAKGSGMEASIVNGALLLRGVTLYRTDKTGKPLVP